MSDIRRTAQGEKTSPEQNAEPNLFTCDHVVRLIWNQLLRAAVVHGRGLDLDRHRLHDYANIKIQQMPRNIRYTTTEKSGELVVSFTSMEPHANTTKPMRVTLHSPHCGAKIEWANGMYHSKSQGKSSTDKSQS
jgi:hypothetical protein